MECGLAQKGAAIDRRAKYPGTLGIAELFDADSCSVTGIAAELADFHRLGSGSCHAGSNS